MQFILDFLSDLAQHNNRDWMQENKKRYLEAKKLHEDFIAKLIQGIATFDPSVSDLGPKDCTFRINRDIRFSKNKDPYKINFGAAMMEGGKKTSNPTYYLHLQPGGSFMAGGIYMPDAEMLKKIRQEIDYNAKELKDIVEASKFQKTYGAITGESLKTAPKGYPKDHPNIELLRMKSFIVTKDLSDTVVLKDGFLDQLVVDYELIYPFNQYLAVAIS
ncbi:MAG: DUF2461 domain-containing protein [Bacteroidota bacterium]